MKRKVITVLTLLAVTALLWWPVRYWALKPAYCLCTIIGGGNNAGPAAEQAVEHFGPIILQRQFLDDDIDQAIAYAGWKRVETDYRLMTICVAEWVAICGLILAIAWRRKCRPADGQVSEEAPS